MDKIFLTALSTEAVIGIFDWEREIKQRLDVDLELSLDLAAAGNSDSIHDTLNYKVVAKRVLAFVGESRFQLVETLAERIAGLLLAEFPIARVRVTVHKPGAIRNSSDVGVVIERSRDA
ncbi:MAG: dihydroneopterin aldolase [Gammaproteobacteria bacterium]|nr:dihydroneopterin aldolase [Gammaproteobacteria bacterium]